MPEEISVQVLSQTSENIQKLFDLSTRIDERVKSVQAKQEDLDKRIEEVIQRQIEVAQKVAILEHERVNSSLQRKLEDCEDQVTELDKRMARVESDAGRSSERWKGIASFVVQLIWVILAAYLLTKMNLQAPAVP